MAVKVISGVKAYKPKSKPKRPKQFGMYVSDEDLQRLDECAGAAQTSRSDLIRRLILLAHRDLLLWRETAERKAIEPSNGHEVSEEEAK